MNIIHYIIGLPPFRKGGAAIYAVDLLKAQSLIEGCNVSILIPGDTLWICNSSNIKKIHDFKGIPCYTIENPVIEPLMNGVRSAEYILNGERNFDKKDLKNFYNKTKPDLIHIHTLMGIPREFLVFMKNMGVKIVMTSHDYYGICPRVNLIDKYGNICNDTSGDYCKDCNSGAKQLWKLKIINSSLFVYGKRYIPPFIKKNFKQSLAIPPKTKGQLIKDDSDSFIKLRNYYESIFNLIDAIHFNSNVSKNIFTKHIDLPYNQVIPITNEQISDRRRKKTFSSHIRFTFIGGLGRSKGFPLLKEVLIKLYEGNYKDWKLTQWGTSLIAQDNDCRNINYKGRYIASQLEAIYDNTDVLVVPSVWSETFSFVALEALSFGVPVLMSDNVGAQLLIKDIAPSFIFRDKKELENKIREILENPHELDLYNSRILEAKNINFSEEKHAKDMVDFYKKVILK